MTASSVPESPEPGRKQLQEAQHSARHQEHGATSQDEHSSQGSSALPNALERVKSLRKIAEWIDLVVPTGEEIGNAAPSAGDELNLFRRHITGSKLASSDLDSNLADSNSEFQAEVNSLLPRDGGKHEQVAIWCEDVEKKMRQEEPFLWCDVLEDEEDAELEAMENEKSGMLCCDDLEKALIHEAKDRETVADDRAWKTSGLKDLPRSRRSRAGAVGQRLREGRAAQKQYAILPRSSTPVQERRYNGDSYDLFRRSRHPAVSAQEMWSQRSHWPPRCEKDSNWRQNTFMRS